MVRRNVAKSNGFTSTLHLRQEISHTPLGGQTIDEVTRSAMLTAIASSRAWSDTILKDRRLCENVGWVRILMD
jgi:hypothetical protein